jgi:hypothetical protein
MKEMGCTFADSMGGSGDGCTLGGAMDGSMGGWIIDMTLSMREGCCIMRILADLRGMIGGTISITGGTMCELVEKLY